jgi:hypothetical protein
VEPVSRLKALQDSGKPHSMPPVGIAAHLVGYLMDAGPVSHGGMGPAPISHADIAAWQANTGVELTAWESRTVRKLSSEYVAMMGIAKESDCPAPYVDASIVVDQRANVSAQLRSLFGGRTEAKEAY